MPPEEQARQQIDAMLTACGWSLQNYRALNFSAGRGIARAGGASQDLTVR